MTGDRDDESPTAYAIRVVKEQGAREALAALRQRCAEKVPVLKAMADEREDDRLKGKAEGLSLAISYLDEYVRVEGLALGVDLDAALAKEGADQDSDDQNLAEHTARTQGGLADALERFARAELANLDPDLPRAPIAEGAGS